MTESPNERQVGGDHYKRRGAVQHWDLVVSQGGDYLRGQITKYLDRHKVKKGREDLEKSLHYSQKLTEEMSRGRNIANPHYRSHQVSTYALAAGLDGPQTALFHMAFSVQVSQGEELTAAIRQYMEDQYPTMVSDAASEKPSVVEHSGCTSREDALRHASFLQGRMQQVAELSVDVQNDVYAALAFELGIPRSDAKRALLQSLHGVLGLSDKTESGLQRQCVRYSGRDPHYIGRSGVILSLSTDSITASVLWLGSSGVSEVPARDLIVTGLTQECYS